MKNKPTPAVSASTHQPPAKSWHEALTDLVDPHCDHSTGECLYHILYPFIEKEIKKAVSEERKAIVKMIEKRLPKR